ncbi:hypothetical protein BHE74_00000496 [Ensete ventricosum]|nr:hypothetical protein BHE74_00000496 [Ensete ventricosum]RZR84095.1 hypothetical protein BHM03_00010850 [Ensete ventricosum]
MGTAEECLHQFVEETDWYNGIVLDALVPGGSWKRLPRPLQSWLRNYIGGTALYLVSGFLWCFYIYYLKRNVYIPKDSIPSNKAMLLQIIVAMKAMPWYCMLPTLSEYMVENGWTRCFSSAVPHVIALFLVASHFRTHILLLFCEAVWTANIHDCIHGKTWPVMGAGYHTIHHTTYRHNYGHYTVWMDQIFGTLRDPEEEFKKAD